MGDCCAICGKKPKAGKNVSHSAVRTPRRFLPNLQSIRIRVNGAVKRARVCTDCIKNGRVLKASGRSTPLSSQPRVTH